MKDVVNFIVMCLVIAVVVTTFLITVVETNSNKEYIEVLVDANREMLDSISQLREQILEIECQIERLEKAE
jgi:hypothetical protein